MKNFTSVNDVENVQYLVNEALSIKKSPWMPDSGKGKTMGLLFFNPSLRTRLSTQKAALNLGMNVITMNVNEDGWNIEFIDGAVMDQGNQEHIKDAVRVISQYCDILGVRTFAGLKNRDEDYKETVLANFLKYASIPIISLESATLHPLQSLADLITIQETKIVQPKVVVSWAPHPRALPQAVVNSFLEWIVKTEAEIVLTHPPGYELDTKFTTGLNIEHDQEKAFMNADFVYAKNWSSFQKYGEILSTDSSWTITAEKMSLTNQGRFMHCLPIRRNVVASDEVIDNSMVIEQANNRTFAAQAVINEILKDQS